MVPMLDGKMISDARKFQIEMQDSLLTASVGWITIVANTEAHFITLQAFIVSQSALGPLLWPGEHSSH
jgi:hypothetical protein